MRRHEKIENPILAARRMGMEDAIRCQQRPDVQHWPILWREAYAGGHRDGAVIRDLHSAVRGVAQ